MVVVGRIARAHGIRGQIIVDPDTLYQSDDDATAWAAAVVKL